MKPKPNIPVLVRQDPFVCFLAVDMNIHFTQDGMPMDEPSKAMLYAALKLRLSLVGSMLGTICSSDTTALDWTTLLMQLICSGAVDRQTDSRFVLPKYCGLLTEAVF